LTLTVNEPTRDESGLWSVSFWPGHADELLAALDPTVPFVIIACGDPSLGWHDAPVAIGAEPPRLRRVRALNFEVLVDPADAKTLGPSVRASHDGELDCIQMSREPAKHFRLPPSGVALRQAIRSLGVHLIVHLPHDAEVGMARSADEQPVEEFARRLTSR